MPEEILTREHGLIIWMFWVTSISMGKAMDIYLIHSDQVHKTYFISLDLKIPTFIENMTVDEMMLYK